MSLQSKVLALVILVFIALGGLTYAVQHLFILPSFEALEQEEARKDMDRAMEAVDRETQHLTVSATDWAVWDDMYVFMEDGNETFRNANLNFASMRNLKVNLLYIYRPDGELVWGKALDFQTDEETPVAAFAGALLPREHPLVSPRQPDVSVRGILVTERGALLLAARAIVTGAGEGKVRGSVVLGRFLTDSAIRELAKQARVNLTITPLMEGRVSGPDAAIVDEIDRTGGSVIRDRDEISRVYGVIPDIFGRPALLVRVDVPKSIYVQGQTAVRFAMLSLFLSGMVVLFVLMAGLRIVILKPTRKLTAHAVEIGEKGNLTTHLDLNRRDELGILAGELNRMVDHLVEARQKLMDQSFQLGISEMAGGVLHNIGNAVTPLKVRVAGLSDIVASAPTAELRMALDELADANTPPDRRLDLQQFARLASREFTVLLDKTAEQLVGISYQVDHVARILSDQERFSRAARVVEQVPVEALVRESVDVLGEELRREIRIEPGAGLRETDPVLGSRVALQQVLVNLIKNSAESIRQASRETGTGLILIDAKAEEYNGRRMIHLSVKDNGAGIAPENMSRLFERGYSTKTRSSGLGLHWSALTVKAMDGYISAESAGPGQGARINLLLPRAEPATAPSSPAA